MRKLIGSLTIEAALVLPMFLFALCALGYLIKVVYIHEQVQFALNEAATEMATEVYIIEKGGIIDLQQGVYQQADENVQVTTDALESILDTLEGLTDFNLRSEGKEISIHEGKATGTTTVEKLSHLSQELTSIKNQIESEAVNAINGIVQVIESIQIISQDSQKILVSLGAEQGMEVVNNAIGSKFAACIVNQHISEKDYKQWHIVNGKKGMDYSRSQFLLSSDDILLSVRYQIQIPFLQNILKPLNMTQAVKIRAFTGNGNFKARYKKSEEANTQGPIVYITKKGSKYHTDRNCRYIDVKIKETIFEKVKSKESICEICAKDKVELADTTVVYSTDPSSIFHIKKTCWTIQREVISITYEEAIEKGYGLCHNCKPIQTTEKNEGDKNDFLE